MSAFSFLDRTNDRLTLATNTPVFVWDIDKTYLDTRFSSWRGLLRIPFELALDKRAVPGAVPLLRGLRHGPANESTLAPLYFVSGSPKELRSIIERKMTLDGVEFDGITFKDQLGLLRARMPRGIVAQVGFKLRALLALSVEIPMGAPWVLVGDDVEKDQDAFMLFGEVLAGLRGPALASRMRQEGALVFEVEEAVRFASHLPLRKDPVRRMVILSVAGRSRPSADPRIVVCRSFLQAALVLAGDGFLLPAAVRDVVNDLLRRGCLPQELLAQAQEANARWGANTALVTGVIEASQT